MRTPRAPEPPDPVRTAQAQAQYNQEAAINEARLNRINSFGPFGSTVYTEGPDNRWSSFTTLSPEEQAKYDLENRLTMSGGRAAEKGLNFLSDRMGQGYDLNALPPLRTTVSGGSGWGQPQTLQRPMPMAAMGRGGASDMRGEVTLDPAAGVAQTPVGSPDAPMPGVQTLARPMPMNGMTRVDLAADPAMTGGMMAQPMNGQAAGPQAAFQAPMNRPAPMAAEDRAPRLMSDVPYFDRAAFAPRLVSDVGYDAGTRQRVEGALFDRMRPEQDRARDRMHTMLMNQGLSPGTEAYNRQMDALGRQENDARLAAIMSGGQEESRALGNALEAADFRNRARGQAFGEDEALFGRALTRASFRNQARGQAMGEIEGRFGRDLRSATFENQARAQALQELMGSDAATQNLILAMAGLNQVQTPQMFAPGMPNVAAPDYQGAVGQQYQGQLANYQARMQQRNAMLGGLFGLAGTAGSAAIGRWG
jgi:hypothetical protein